MAQAPPQRELVKDFERFGAVEQVRDVEVLDIVSCATHTHSIALHRATHAPRRTHARTGDDVRVALAQELRPLQKHFALTLERPHVGAHDRLHTCTRIIAIHKSNPRTQTPCTGSGVNVNVDVSANVNVNVNVNVNAKVNDYVTVNAHIHANGHANVSVNADVNVTVHGKAHVNVNVNVNMEC